jgi:hypothetical protein
VDLGATALMCNCVGELLLDDLLAVGCVLARDRNEAAFDASKACGSQSQEYEW